MINAKSKKAAIGALNNELKKKQKFIDSANYLFYLGYSFSDLI
jgi:hypothetical protein